MLTKKEETQFGLLKQRTNQSPGKCRLTYCGGDTGEIRREVKKIVIPIKPVSLTSPSFLPFNRVMNFNIAAYLLKVLCRCPLRVRTDSFFREKVVTL